MYALNKRYRTPQGKLRMDNPKTRATLGTYQCKKCVIPGAREAVIPFNSKAILI